MPRSRGRVNVVIDRALRSLKCPRCDIGREVASANRASQAPVHKSDPRVARGRSAPGHKSYDVLTAVTTHFASFPLNPQGLPGHLLSRSLRNPQRGVFGVSAVSPDGAACPPGCGGSPSTPSAHLRGAGLRCEGSVCPRPHPRRPGRWLLLTDHPVGNLGKG